MCIIIEFPLSFDRAQLAADAPGTHLASAKAWGDSLGRQPRRRAEIEVRSLLRPMRRITPDPSIRGLAQFGSASAKLIEPPRGVVEKYHAVFGRRRRRGSTFHPDLYGLKNF
jgi:hypothetical protein